MKFPTIKELVTSDVTLLSIDTTLIDINLQNCM